MNHIQEKTFTLLKEVITICESSGIRYYAGSETLRLAMVFGGHSSESVNLDILIPAEDMMKFVEAARKTMKSGRAVEYMGNNKYFSLFEINYVDTTTTFLNVKEGWDVACPGARIIIRPIRRNVTGFRHTYNGVLESGMERTGYRAFRKISGKNVLSVLLVYLHSIFGRAAMSRRMFRRFTKVYSGMSEIVLIKRHRGETREVAGSHFNGGEGIAFESITIFGPNDPAGFLEEYLGPEWRERTEERARVYTNVIVSSVTPYEEVLKQSRYAQRIQQIHSLNMRNKFSKVFFLKNFGKYNEAVKLLRRSGDRLDLYEYFQARRDVIYNLYNAGDYEQLEEVFLVYEKKALSYLSEGLGLCVSKEYMDILCAILRHNGMEEEAAELERLAPKEHYLPVGQKA